MPTLLQLARNKLPQLSPVEVEALERLELGEEFVNPVKVQPRGSGGPSNSYISGDLIGLLCSDPQAVKKLTPHGIRLNGIRIEGELKLAALNIPFNISLRDCNIPCPIDLRKSSVAALDLSRSTTVRIDADGLTVSGTMLMTENFRADGPVSLKAATIKGDLLCTGGNFDNHVSNAASTTRISCEDCKSSTFHPYALVLARAKIEGSLYLCGGFTANGGVNLSDATIGVNVNCTNGKFTASCLESNPAQSKIVHRLACDANAAHLACALNLEGMYVKGNLLMGKVAVRGETRFTGTLVDKDLDAWDGAFINPGGWAIHGDRLRVRGNVFFCDRFKAEGGVRLPRAEIGADISFYHGHLSESGEPRALFCEGIRVQGTVHLEQLVAKDGCLDFSYSTIGGNLDCTDCTLHGVDGWALKTIGSDIRGSAFLSSSESGQFEAVGLVALTGAKLGQDLICFNAKFQSPNVSSLEKNTPCALKADNMIICGKVELSGERFAAAGVNLNDTNIESFLSCEQGTFHAPADDGNFKCAISAGNLQVSGSIDFTKVVSHGEIMLNEASTGRNLICRNARLTSDKRYRDFTLRAAQIKVAGSVHMEDLVSDGEIRIDLARIGGHLHCSTARFINNCTGHYALRAFGISVGGCAEFNKQFHADGVVSIENANIGRHFEWRDIDCPEKATLYLNSTKVGCLNDEQKSWPKELQLDGFEYEFLEDLTWEGLQSRKRWLQLVPSDTESYFRPQPFEQLAKVLRRIGYEERAKSILVEKNRIQTKLPRRWSKKNEKKYPLTQSPLTYFLRRIHSIFVDYGYKPSKALFCGLLFVVVGCFAFYEGFENKLMVPAKKDSETFNVYQIGLSKPPSGSTVPNITCGRLAYALVYSLDTFIPVVNLQTEEYWLPTAYPDQHNINWGGAVLCVYRWIHILFGWIIASFYIAALSGVVRK